MSEMAEIQAIIASAEARKAAAAAATPAQPPAPETATTIMEMGDRQLLDYYDTLCKELTKSISGDGARCHSDVEVDRKLLEYCTFHLRLQCDS